MASDISKYGTSGLRFQLTDKDKDPSANISIADQLHLLASLSPSKIKSSLSAKSPTEYVGDLLDMMGYGHSVYDKNIASVTQANDLNEVRAGSQPGLLLLGNGLLKGITTAATTFMNGTVGLLYGVGTGIGNLAGLNGENEDGSSKGFFQGLWDNDFNDAMTNAQNAMEEIAPNYYSRAELLAPWYENIFSTKGVMNFWGDKVLKNTGFTVGALGAIAFTDFIGAGSIFGELVQGTGKLLTGLTRATGAGMHTLATMNKASRIAGLVANYIVRDALSATSEASIEALNAVKEADKTIEENLNTRYNELINNLDENDPFYEAKKKGIDQAVEAYRKKAKGELVDAGNSVYGLNMAILSLTNSLEFGSILKGGFNQSAKLADYALKANGKEIAKNALGRELLNDAEIIAENRVKKGIGTITLKTLKNAASEGFEEGAQNIASNTNKTWVAAKMNSFGKDSLLGSRINPEVTDEITSYSKAYMKTLSDLFGGFEKPGWEEVFLGALTGGMGFMSIRNERVKDAAGNYVKDTDGKIKTKIRPIWEGGFMEAYRSTKQEYDENQKLVDMVNKKLKDPEFIERTKHAVSSLDFEQLKQAALEANDMFAFKNSEVGKLVNDVFFFRNIGMLDEYKSIYLEMANGIDDKTLALLYATTATKNKETLKELSALSRDEIEDVRKTYQDKAKKNLDTMQEILDYYDFVEENHREESQNFKEELAYEYVRLYDTLKRIDLLEELNKTKNNGLLKPLREFAEGITIEDAPNGEHVINLPDKINFREKVNGLTDTLAEDLKKLYKQRNKLEREIKRYEKDPYLMDKRIQVKMWMALAKADSINSEKLYTKLTDAKDNLDFLRAFYSADPSVRQELLRKVEDEGDEELVKRLITSFESATSLDDITKQITKVYHGDEETAKLVTSVISDLFIASKYSPEDIHKTLLDLLTALNNKDEEAISLIVGSENTMLSLLYNTETGVLDLNKIDMISDIIDSGIDMVATAMNSAKVLSAQTLSSRERKKKSAEKKAAKAALASSSGEEGSSGKGARGATGSSKTNADFIKGIESTVSLKKLAASPKNDDLVASSKAFTVENLDKAIQYVESKLELNFNPKQLEDIMAVFTNLNNKRVNKPESFEKALLSDTVERKSVAEAIKAITEGNIDDLLTSALTGSRNTGGISKYSVGQKIESTDKKKFAMISEINEEDDTTTVIDNDGNSHTFNNDTLDDDLDNLLNTSTETNKRVMSVGKGCSTAVNNIMNNILRDLNLDTDKPAMSQEELNKILQVLESATTKLLKDPNAELIGDELLYEKYIVTLCKLGLNEPVVTEVVPEIEVPGDELSGSIIGIFRNHSKKAAEQMGKPERQLSNGIIDIQDEEFCKKWFESKQNAIKVQHTIDRKLLKLPKETKIRFIVVNDRNDLLYSAVDFNEAKKAGITEKSAWVVDTLEGKFVILGVAGFNNKSHSLHELYNGIKEDTINEKTSSGSNAQYYVGSSHTMYITNIGDGRMIDHVEGLNNVHNVLTLLSEAVDIDSQFPKETLLKWSIVYSDAPHFVNLDTTKDKIHTGKPIDPTKDAGKVFIYLPTASGVYYRHEIKPLFYNEINDGKFKKRLDLIIEDIIKKRTESSVIALKNALVLDNENSDDYKFYVEFLDTGNIKIDYVAREGTKDTKLGTIWLGGEKSVLIQQFKDFLSDLINPRVSISLSQLKSSSALKELAEAGALDTVSAVSLFTQGANFSLSEKIPEGNSSGSEHNGSGVKNSELTVMFENGRFNKENGVWYKEGKGISRSQTIDNLNTIEEIENGTYGNGEKLSINKKKKIVDLPGTYFFIPKGTGLEIFHKDVHGNYKKLTGLGAREALSYRAESNKLNKKKPIQESEGVDYDIPGFGSNEETDEEKTAKELLAKLEVRNKELVPDTLTLKGTSFTFKNFNNGVAVYTDEFGHIAGFFSGIDNDTFIGAFKIGNSFIQILRNGTKNTKVELAMILKIMDAIPDGTSLIASTNLSMKALKLFTEELKHGFSIDTSRTVIAKLSGTEFNRIFDGEKLSDEEDSPIKTDKAGLEKIKKAIKPLLEKLDISEEDVYLNSNGEVCIKTHPLIKGNVKGNEESEQFKNAVFSLAAASTLEELNSIYNEALRRGIDPDTIVNMYNSSKERLTEAKKLLDLQEINNILKRTEARIGLSIGDEIQRNGEKFKLTKISWENEGDLKKAVIKDSNSNLYTSSEIVGFPVYTFESLVSEKRTLKIYAGELDILLKQKKYEKVNKLESFLAFSKERPTFVKFLTNSENSYETDLFEVVNELGANIDEEDEDYLDKILNWLESKGVDYTALQEAIEKSNPNKVQQTIKEILNCKL